MVHDTIKNNFQFKNIFQQSSEETYSTKALKMLRFNEVCKLKEFFKKQIH